MPINTLSEQNILNELHQLPKDRWEEVLAFIRSLHAGQQQLATASPILSGADLADSELIGIWADRADITDSREFARQLRQQAEHRQGTTDAVGH